MSFLSKGDESCNISLNLFNNNVCLLFVFFSFEEMRMRYERRDPRPEDLRQIDELKSLTDTQEKDIFHLTEELRELQLQHQQLQQQFSSLQQNSSSSNNNNQSKRNNKSKNNKNSNNSNNVKSQNHNGNANNSVNPQMNHMPTSSSTNNNTQQQSQTNTNQNHQQQQQQQGRVKPPPLIKTVIYEEENENELCEEQLREERENNAKRIYQNNSSDEFNNNSNGVMVELVPESPDCESKHQHEEISEAQIITDNELLKNVPILMAPISNGKSHEIQVEVISTIEPSNIQIVPNFHKNSSQFESEF
jgi:hypothetical protein